MNDIVEIDDAEILLDERYIAQLIDTLRWIIKERIWDIIPDALPGDICIRGNSFDTDTHKNIIRIRIIYDTLSRGDRKFIGLDISWINNENDIRELKKVETFILMGIYFHLTLMDTIFRRGHSFKDAERCKMFIDILNITLKKVRALIDTKVIQ